MTARIGLFALLLPALAAASETRLEAPPAVTRVVVAPDGALVTRAREVACGTGLASVRFPSLPPSLEPSTIRATVLGSEARVEGVSVAARVLREAYSAELSELDVSMEKLQTRRQQVVRAQQRASAARERARSLRQSALPLVAREAATQARPGVPKWGAAFDVARTAAELAEDQRLEADIELRRIDREMEELQARRRQLASAAPRRAFDAEVIVRCKGRARVDLTAFTSAARWSPAYAARADEAAGTVAFTVHAEVAQWTAEEWKAADVVLTTATARRDARPPTPLRLYVGAREEEDRRKVLVRREEAASRLHDVGESAGADGGADASEEGLSVRIAVPGRTTLAGDGRPATLQVEALRLPAEFGLTAVPKMLPLVVRSARMMNGAKYPLLPGPVDLFSASGFLGTAHLQRTAEGDRLLLAFGAADGVRVRRTTLTEDRRDPGFLSSTRRLLYGYRIELESTEPKPISVTLQEHVPVSELDDVKVLVDRKTTPGFEARAADGLLTWNVELAAGEKKTVELHFVVEIPEKYESAGL